MKEEISNPTLSSGGKNQKMAMEMWMPPESESNASFWIPLSESEEGSIWIPSSESEGCFWKPSFAAGKCYNLDWAAVHGMVSLIIPIVSFCEQDMKRVGSYYQRYYTNEKTLRCLTEALISEIECLPYDNEEFRGKGIEKPFGVVSVIRNTTKVNASS